MIRNRRVPARRGREARAGTLGLRLGLCLLLAGAALYLRLQQPEMLAPVGEALFADTGEVAQAFARFTGRVSGGGQVVEAWQELLGALGDEA